ncbi:hypothetical protein [Clostridium beijerinckii]|uniref:hypothetical protein n=1 Tax=Clostridium beijerinckii TaxID=1520 RepID=UPI001F1F09DB|nr:hypothetical protein [Clostridium beijerinckii]
MINYDKIVVVIYIRTYKDTYSYEDIKNYLGFSYTEVNDFIEDMTNEEMLEYNEDFILQVTEKGEQLLKQLNLQDISFEDLIVDYQEKMVEQIKVENKLEIYEIYIPRYFDEKFKGYGDKRLS